MFRFLILFFLVGAWGLATHVGAIRADEAEPPAVIPGNGVTAAEVQNAQPYTITVKGNSSIPERDLLKAAENELRMFEQRGFRKADIDDAAFQMRSKYLQSGFADVHVEYSYEKKGEHIQVTFDVREGPQVFVENIVFQGNNNMTAETLSGFFRDTDEGLIKKQKRVFVEAEVRDGMDSMRNHYRGEGFDDVVVKESDLAFNGDRTGVVITIIIEEGPQYIIRDLKLSGDLIPELSPELEKIKKDIIGKPYFVRQKLFLRISLEDAYDKAGYADADIVVEAVRLEEPGTIMMLGGITSGGRVTIDEVAVSGNEKTKESFIRDRMVLKPGDTYTRAKRTESFRNLYESGLFALV